MRALRNMADIFDYGFDKGLKRNITNRATGVVYDTVGDTVNTGSVIQGGNLTLKTLNVGGLVRQVAPGDDINAAIDAVSRDGGGIVQLVGRTYTVTSDINLKPDVTLAGAGVDVTILDFSGSTNLINIVGLSSSIYENVHLRDFTLQNSNALRGILVQFADRWSFENLRVHNCGTTGIQIQDAQYFTLYRCRASSNGASGYFVAGTNSRQTSRFSFIACTADANTTNGFRISSGTNDLFWGSFLGCVASSNVTNGFLFDATSGSGVETALTSCVAGSNAKGFVTDSFSQRVRFVNCTADANTGDGFEVVGDGFSIIGCISGDGFDIQGAGNFIGNDNTASNADPKATYILAEKQIQSYMNLNENPRSIRKTNTMKALSGATIREGMTVIFARGVGAEGELIYATNGNHADVFGMADEDIIGDAWGRTLVQGVTTKLWVSNSTTSITTGNYLEVSTWATGYAQATTAANGGHAFAIALSSPTTTTAQISAVLIPLRKVL